MVKKLSVEFKELLTAKALGHFMDSIVCRAFSLGPILPIIKRIQVENAKTASNGSQLEARSVNLFYGTVIINDILFPFCESLPIGWLLVPFIIVSYGK